MAAGHVFRRHVCRFAFHDARSRELHTISRLGDAEVDQTAVPVRADEQVFRRQVAMHQVQPLAIFIDQFVGGVQTVQCVEQHRYDDRRGA